MASHIRQLLNLITVSVDKLETACKASKCTIPDLHSPFTPQSEAFRANPAAAEAATIISAAALHLEAILSPPQVSLYHVVAGGLKAAALRVCLESNVTEILREAGPEGLHVDAIAAKNGMDARKLSRLLRCLAINHVYREVKPDIFANTRISSMLDTLKPSADLFASPQTKHDNTSGVAALAGHHLDEAFKAAAHAWEFMSDPVASKSGSPKATPFSLLLNEDVTYYQHVAQNEAIGHRFSIGMQGVAALQPPDTVLKAYDWSKLAPRSVVVDVGGGLGTSSLPLAREFPSLELVIQDLPPVIEDAKKVWATTLPNAEVTLEVHDFFTPQPSERNVSIFLLKHIIHDWSDEYATKILSQLRAAAGPDTRLLLIETIIPYACHDYDDDESWRIPGALPLEAPPPLLANFGAVNELTYTSDMVMFLLLNSQERTIRHLDELLLSTGWMVERVRRQEGSNAFLQSVEATPVPG